MPGIARRIIQYYETTAKAAQHYSITRYGVKVDRPRQLTRMQEASCFLKGLYYSAADFSRKDEMQRALVLAPAGEGNTIAATAYMTVINLEGSSRIDLRDTAEKMMTIFKANPKAKLSIDRLVDLFNGLYSNSPTMNPDLCQAALNILIFNKQVEEIEGGSYRFFNQESAVKKVSANLSNELVNVNSLHQLIEIVGKQTRGLFRNFDLYLKDGETGQIRIVIRGENASSFDEWKKEETKESENKNRKGAFEQVLVPRGGRFIYIESIQKEAENEKSPIFPGDLEKYMDRYENPTEVVFSGIPINKRGDAVLVKLNEWSPKGNGPQQPFYSPNHSNPSVVNKAIEELVNTVAQKVKDILAQNSNLALRELWEKEEGKIARDKRISSPGVEPPAKETKLAGINSLKAVDQLAPQLLALVKTKCALKDFGVFPVGRIANPASNLTEEEKNLLAGALNWQGRSHDDMRKHLENVSEVVVVFYGGKPVAFGSGCELDFNNEGVMEKHLQMTGTICKSDFYELSMQTLVNGLFLLRAWWRFKKTINIVKAFFKTPHLFMRTRSVVPAVGFWRYFSDVKVDRLSGRNLARAKEFSRHMGKECDDNGVVNGAYDEPVGDAERDEQVLNDLKKKDPKMHAKITASFEGLSLFDARIHQGLLKLKDVIKIWTYLTFIFPRMYRTEQKLKAKMESNKRKRERPVS